MNLGWRGLLKAVAASVTLTSVVWIGLGVWWYQHHAGATMRPHQN